MFYLDFSVFYVQTVHLVIKKFYILSIMLTLVHSVSCRILVAEYRPILGVPRCFALGEKTERNIAIMEYLSVTETAKKWGVSQVLIRKLCRQKTDTKSQML